MPKSLESWLASLVALALVACTPYVPPASPQQRARVHVTMYSTRWCPVCARARSWLERRGIPYDDLDVETSTSAAARHRALNPARTVPTIVVEGRVLIGFAAEDLRMAVDTAAQHH